MLANMYMFDIDAQINACVASVNGRYIRYCDDLIIVVPAKDLKTASKALALAQGVPAVELQDEKNKIHRVNDGKVEQLSFDALLAGEMEVVQPCIMLEIMFRFWDLILTVKMSEFANLRSAGFTAGFIVLLNQSAGWLTIRTSIRVRNA